MVEMEFCTYILGLIIVFLIYTWKTLLKYVQVYMELCKIPKLPFKSYPLVGHALSLPSEPDKFFKAYLKVSEQLSTEKSLFIFIILIKMICIYNFDTIA